MYKQYVTTIPLTNYFNLFGLVDYKIFTIANELRNILGIFIFFARGEYPLFGRGGDIAKNVCVATYGL